MNDIIARIDDATQRLKQNFFKEDCECVKCAVIRDLLDAYAELKARIGQAGDVLDRDFNNRQTGQ